MRVEVWYPQSDKTGTWFINSNYCGDGMATNGIPGHRFPVLTEVKRDYVKVFDAMDVASMEDVFRTHQAEMMLDTVARQPCMKGAGHTSMSVGDVIHVLDDDTWFIVAGLGFKPIKETATHEPVRFDMGGSQVKPTAELIKAVG